MSQGQVAIDELQRRFGARVDVKRAFEHMDATLRKARFEATVLRNFLCGAAWDIGVIIATFEAADARLAQSPADYARTALVFDQLAQVLDQERPLVWWEEPSPVQRAPGGLVTLA